VIQSSEKQQRWDQRYQQQSVSEKSSAYILRNHQYLLTGHGDALDLACGLGANAIFLAKNGYQVTAIDFSDAALDKLSSYAREQSLAVTTRQIDLSSCLLGDDCYDVIVVSYYLQRDLFPVIFNSLKSGGLLFYQTYSGKCINGCGPENPAFRLQQGELLSLCAGHSILYYREDSENCTGPECLNGEAMIVVKRD